MRYTLFIIYSSLSMCIVVVIILLLCAYFFIIIYCSSYHLANNLNYTVYFISIIGALLDYYITVVLRGLLLLLIY